MTPSPGSHEHARGTVVSLAASPTVGWQFAGWTGLVADPNSQQTMVTMDDDHRVHAVFVTGDVSPPDEIDGALCNLEFEGDGFAAHYQTWNCEGLEGVWQIQGQIVVDAMDIMGMIEGEHSFTMPPRPESGPWESAPFSWSMSGTVEADPALIEIGYHMEDIIVTLIELPSGTRLMDSRGGGTAVVTVTLPDSGPITVLEEYFDIVFVPTLVRYERHAECD